MASHTWCDYKGGQLEKHPTYTDDRWQSALVVFYNVTGHSDLVAIESYRRKSLNEFEFNKLTVLSRDDACRFVTDMGYQWLGGVPMADAIGLEGRGQSGLFIGFETHPVGMQFFEPEKESA